jgi:hypothetical protein
VVLATNPKKHRISQHFCTDFFSSLQKIRKVGVEKCSGEGRIERLWDTLLKGPSLA